MGHLLQVLAGITAAAYGWWLGRRAHSAFVGYERLLCRWDAGNGLRNEACQNGGLFWCGLLELCDDLLKKRDQSRTVLDGNNGIVRGKESCHDASRFCAVKAHPVF